MQEPNEQIIEHECDSIIKMFYEDIFDINNGADVKNDNKRYLCAISCSIKLSDKILQIINDGNPTESQYNFWLKVRQKLHSRYN